MKARAEPSSWRWLVAVPVGIAVALLLESLRAPLAWMLGPLLALAAANAAGARIRLPNGARYAGQWLIGSALGLYFVPAVLAQIVAMSGWIAVAVVLSIATSAIGARILVRVGGADRATAFFASSVGGAAEMANAAERHGARVDQVAAAQAIRVLVVVLLVPVAFRIADVHGSDVYHAAVVPFGVLRLGALLAATFMAGLLCARIRVPNGWMLGPLALSTALTATDHALSSVPAAIVNAGQLLIGCSLGARFAPEFFRESPRYVAGVLASAGALLAGCALAGLAVALASGTPVPTALLATAPGGLAEMALTAKVLQLGVPVVTAFHTVRLTTVVLTAGVAYRLLVARRQQR